MSHPQRTAFLTNQRWFAGKGRAFEVTGVSILGHLSERVRIELVDVRYAEGEPRTEQYQMPVVTYPEPQDRLEHALVRTDDGEWTYDAVHDREAMDVIYRAFAGPTATTLDGIDLHRVGEPVLDTEVHSAFFSGEQSNTSVVFGEEAILKVFRKLPLGHNPDIEIHRALTEAGNDHVAQLYGWLSADTPAGTFDLAMLQQFLRTASDGWELAKTSARNLFAEGDLHAGEVGGDFAAESHRLGGTVAGIHQVLAEAFGTTTVDGALLAEQMQRRLDAAVVVVPELKQYAGMLEARFAALGELGDVPAQRVHGDLHLGQTLRTSLSWKLVDFEGEPAKSLEERRRPDPVWRDVAGMIRSFHYAAAATAHDLDVGAGDAVQIAYRAGEWVAHNVHAFLVGYTEQRGAPLDDGDAALLDAYIADKAVYEAVYEARNRPSWLPIPLAALAEIGERG